VLKGCIASARNYLAAGLLIVAEAASAQSGCSTYQRPEHGELWRFDFHVFSEPNTSRSVNVAYPGEYGDLFNFACASQTLCDSLAFLIDIETGAPMGGSRTRGIPPRDYVHLNLFVQGRAHFPLVKLLPTIAQSYDSPAEEYVLTGERLAGHQLIDYPQDQDPLAVSRRGETEVGISLDGRGEVASILECGRVGAFPNPQCTYREIFDAFGPVLLKVRINRRQLPNLNAAVRRAREFTSCLADDGS
jgi:hypothetical protein